MQQIKLVVPASTSNLGPGFDTLGLALDWPLTVTARSDQTQEVNLSISFSGPPQFVTPLEDLIWEAIRAWEKKSDLAAKGLGLEFHGNLPLARGLGSSAAYRLGAIAAVNAWRQDPLDRSALLKIACALEKHTDNAVPSLVGGLTVSGWEGAEVRFVRHEVSPRYRFVALVPDQALATAEARAALPASVPREDAVQNLQHALWLVHALTQDRPQDFASAFQDFLHQPYREKLVPFLPAVIGAAEAAGAYGAFLSGAGSTIIAVTDAERAEQTAAAMLKALTATHGHGFTRVLKPDPQGLRFL